ncbi:MAG: hypothetical protein R3C19_26415 [Planctomycetaceae bacterium]
MKQQPQPGQQGPKIGQGHASAMFRAGLKELSAILPAFPDSVRPVEEMGLAGNTLPQEVYNDRHPKNQQQQPGHDQPTHQPSMNHQAADHQPEQHSPTIDDTFELSM